MSVFCECATQAKVPFGTFCECATKAKVSQLLILRFLISHNSFNAKLFIGCLNSSNDL